MQGGGRATPAPTPGTGEILEVFDLPEDWSMEDECKKRYPTMWKTMHKMIVDVSNHSYDWSSCVRRPAEREVLRAEMQRGSGARRSGFRATSGSNTTRARNRAVPASAKRYEWESQRLRDAKFDFDAFMPDMEGDADGTLRASRRRLVYMPYIAAFGCDNLPDLLGGDIKVPIGGLRFWASPAACNRLQPGCSLQPSAAWLQPAT